MESQIISLLFCVNSTRVNCFVQAIELQDFVTERIVSTFYYDTIALVQRYMNTFTDISQF